MYFVNVCVQTGACTCTMYIHIRSSYMSVRCVCTFLCMYMYVQFFGVYLKITCTCTCTSIYMYVSWVYVYTLYKPFFVHLNFV